jgi:hypothetical protein
MPRVLPLLLLVALATAGAGAQGQTTGKPAAAAPSSPAKKELAARIVKAQQAGIDRLARQLVEQPAMTMLQRAGPIVQNKVPADQREAVARDLQAEARRYVDEALPVVRQKAQALAPATLGPLLEQRLSEAELKEVAAVLESPAWRKFQALMPELEQAFGEKLVTETRNQVEPRLRALEQSMGRRLGVETPAAAPAPPPAGGK